MTTSARARGHELVSSRLVWPLHRAFGADHRLGAELDALAGRPAPGDSAVEAQLREAVSRAVRVQTDRAWALEGWHELAALSVRDDRWAACFHALPIVTRDSLRGRFALDQMPRPLPSGWRVTATGGSTGQPTPFALSAESLDAKRAKIEFVRQRFGWRPGVPTFLFWGAERDIGKKDRWYRRSLLWGQNFRLASGFKLTHHETRAALDQLGAAGDRACIYGYASLLAEFASQAEELYGCGPDLRRFLPASLSVWNGGEMLLASQRARFARVVGVPIQDLYGSRELGAVAFDDAGTGEYVVLRPAVLVEVLDDHGRPVAPGEEGRLCVTDLCNTATPFIRYDTGDLATAGRCDDLGVVTIRSIQGRRSGLVQVGGTAISGNFLDHLIKDFPEITRFQAIVDPAREHLQLRVQGGVPTSSLVELQRVVLTWTPFEVVDVEPCDADGFERTPTGKREHVIVRSS